MWRMHKNTTGVSLTVFFIYSAPSAETLCSTYMAGSPSGTIIARSSPGKSSLSSMCCSSTHRGSSESVSSLVLAPSTPPGTVHSPKIQHIRPCSDLSKLHRIQLKLINHALEFYASRYMIIMKNNNIEPSRQLFLGCYFQWLYRIG